MVYKDPVYGKFEIKEPVILELLASKPLRRLKKITQHGCVPYNKNYDKKVRRISRFEHSVGVYLLLRQLGASLEEQVHGLIHDVSHTVFSHVVDFLFDSVSQDYHDKFFQKVVEDSKIPRILKKHGFQLSRILDEENYPLARKPLPDLSADRLDYFYRDTLFFFNFDVKGNIETLRAIGKRIVCNNKKRAIELGRYFAKTDDRFWANEFEGFLYHILAEVLGVAIDKGIVTQEDLFSTEDKIWRRLKTAKDKKIQDNLRIFENGKRENLIISYKKPGIYIRKKFRHVDPLVLVNGKIRRLSGIDKKFARFIKKYKERKSRGYWVKYKE